MILLCHYMTAQTENRNGGERWRRTVLSDGGETLCVACGEAYEASSDACPVCGHRSGADGTTDNSDSGSTRGDGSDSSAVGGPNVLDGEDSSADDRSTGTHTADDGGQEAAAETSMPAAEHAGSSPGAGEEYCSACGEVVAVSADHCPHCGANQSDTEKNQFIAAGLSFFFIGAGQVYNGELKRGVGFFFGAISVGFLTILTAGLGSLLLLVVWAWAIYDAYKGAA